ncbi:MAG: NAD(P)H-hydrate dehydratase [Armatimonadetes bacterium]|nr:NAD(P)H-hydrate dehydratase [Armatimonadota bacterium]
MKIVTSEQMRAIDRRAIEEMGVPGVALMENAGLQAARAAARMLLNRGGGGWLYSKEGAFSLPRPALCGKRVAVACGKGNNGGDGFVAARHLRAQGADIALFFTADPGSLKGDADINCRIALRTGLTIHSVQDESAAEAMGQTLACCDLVIDALLGTGVKGEVQPPIVHAIGAVNRCGRPVLAVDVPSGLDADTGRIGGLCVRAARTLTLALPKAGLLLFPGADYAGEIEVADIGMPAAAIEAEAVSLEMTTARYVRERLPERGKNSHKGTFGQALVVAGSVGMTGAAAMAGESAYRAGAGLVRLALPKSLYPMAGARLTEVIAVPVAETPDGGFSPDALPQLSRWLEESRAVCAGCGLSTHPDTAEFMRALARQAPCPMVIDADGLNGLGPMIGEIIRSRPAPTVLTPHPGEMARLLGTSAGEVQSNRLETARSAASEWGAVVVLKGAYTVIAEPGGRTMINPTGNPGMATAGSGDVLAGAIAGLLAQGMEAFEAAACGCYLHGRAGDLAAQASGEAGLMATDIGRHLPEAIRTVGGETV